MSEPPSRTTGAGDDDAERAERVGEGVADDALEVDVVALAAGEVPGRRGVAEQAEDAEREDAAALDRGRVGEAADRRDPMTTLTATRVSPLTSAASTSERW